MRLGEKIKILRVKHGMTQEVLAIHIGVKHSAVSEYEKNKHAPSLGQVKTMARLFGTTADDLLEGEELFIRSAHLDMLPVFSEQLRRLLAENGMSTLQAMKALGISRRHLTKLEQGELVPSYKVLLAIADLFGTTVDFLLGREDLAVALPPDVQPDMDECMSLSHLRGQLAQGRITHDDGKPLDDEDRALLLRQLELFQRAKQAEIDLKDQYVPRRGRLE